MRKETIKYSDFDGTNREEIFYFNLTRAECVALHMQTTGGLPAVLEKIVKANDIGTIYATFEDLLGRSYGVKSDDGRRLMKGKDGELFLAFKETNAYDELMCKLISIPGYSADFFSEVIPAEALEELSNTIDKNASAILKESASTITQVK